MASTTNSSSSATTNGSPSPPITAPIDRETTPLHQIITPGPPPTGATFAWFRDATQEYICWASRQMPAMVELEVADLTEKLRLANEEIEKQRAGAQEAEALREELNKVKAKQEKIEMATLEMVETLAIKVAEAANLKQEVASKDQEIATLQGKVSGLEARVELHNTALHRSEETNRALNAENEQLKSDLTESDEKIEELTKIIKWTSNPVDSETIINQSDRPKKSFGMPKAPGAVPPGSKSFANPVADPIVEPTSASSVSLPPLINLDPARLAAFRDPVVKQEPLSPRGRDIVCDGSENPPTHSNGLQESAQVPKPATAMGKPGFISSFVPVTQSSATLDPAQLPSENRQEKSNGHRRLSESSNSNGPQRKESTSKFQRPRPY